MLRVEEREKIMRRRKTEREREREIVRRKKKIVWGKRKWGNNDSHQLNLENLSVPFSNEKSFCEWMKVLFLTSSSFSSLIIILHSTILFTRFFQSGPLMMMLFLFLSLSLSFGTWRGSKPEADAHQGSSVSVSTGPSPSLPLSLPPSLFLWDRKNAEKLRETYFIRGWEMTPSFFTNEVEIKKERMDREHGQVFHEKRKKQERERERGKERSKREWEEKRLLRRKQIIKMSPSLSCNTCLRSIIPQTGSLHLFSFRESWILTHNRWEKEGEEKMRDSSLPQTFQLLLSPSLSLSLSCITWWARTLGS